jgi:hypothetical protein
MTVRTHVHARRSERARRSLGTVESSSQELEIIEIEMVL